MKKVYLINLLLVILLISMLSGCKKSVTYTPETKDELRMLVDSIPDLRGDQVCRQNIFLKICAYFVKFSPPEVFLRISHICFR